MIFPINLKSGRNNSYTSNNTSTIVFFSRTATRLLLSLLMRQHSFDNSFFSSWMNSNHMLPFQPNQELISERISKQLSYLAPNLVRTCFGNITHPFNCIVTALLPHLHKTKLEHNDPEKLSILR